MAKTDLPVYPNQAPQMMDLTGLRVRLDTLYSDSKGRQKPGIQRRAEKMLQPLRAPLQTILARDEVVLYATHATPSLSLLQQFIQGWAIYRYNLVILIVTNRRLLQLGIEPGGAWKKSIRALAWGDVASAIVKPSLLGGTLKLRLADKTERAYWKLRRADAKALKVILPALITASAGEATGRGMLQLCPSCTGELTLREYRCHACGLAFKDERTLLWRALAIPGGAYFYVGQKWPGVGATIAELYVLIEILVLLSAIRAASRMRSIKDVLGLVAALVFIIALLILEKAFSIYHGRHAVREFLPLDSGSTIGQSTAAVAGV